MRKQLEEWNKECPIPKQPEFEEEKNPWERPALDPQTEGWLKDSWDRFKETAEKENKRQKIAQAAKDGW